MERVDGAGQREVSLGDVGAAVSREWRTAVLVFTAILGVALLLSFVWPTSYQATATVAVQPLSLDPTGTRTSELNIATEQVIVTSRQVAGEAAKELGGVNADDLRDGVSVTIPQDSSALEITATARSADGAANAANAFAGAYLDYRRNAATELADSISQGIDAQISTLLASLTSSSSSSAKATVSQQIADLRAQKSALTGTTVSPGDVVSRAVAPQSPSSPGLPLFLAAGVALGALLGFAAALLRDRLNPRVHSAARLARHVDTRILDGRRQSQETLARQVSLILNAFRKDAGTPNAQAPLVLIGTDPGRYDPLALFSAAPDLPHPISIMSEHGPAGVAEAVGSLPAGAIVALVCVASDAWDEVTAMTEAMAEWGRQPAPDVAAKSSAESTAAAAPPEPEAIVPKVDETPPTPKTAPRKAAPRPRAAAPRKRVAKPRNPEVDSAVETEAAAGADAAADESQSEPVSESA
jgi:capsular polysaccharide biosynthesis protein